MKRLLGVLLLGLGALSMVTVSSAVPGVRSAHVLGATGPGQTAQLWVGAVGTNDLVFRYEVGIDGTMDLDFTLDHGTFAGPGWFAFSSAGEMFVVNDRSFQGHVSRFLNPLGGTPVFNGTFATDLISAHWTTFRNDELFIADPGQGKVVRFTFDALGNAVSNGAIVLAAADGIRVRGVQVNPATDELFLTICCGVNAVRRYIIDAGGNAVPNGSITGGGLGNPHDMVFSPWGELFVVNGGSHTISRFVFDAIIDEWVPNGVIAESSLSVPLGVDFSPWGELFVANRNDGLIHRWSFDASFNETFNGSFLHLVAGNIHGIHDLMFSPPSTIQVEIDIKPGSFPSSFSCTAVNASLPVAVLGGTGFDATGVDADSVRFGKDGTEAAEVHQKKGVAKRHIEDINKDGFLDMVFHFTLADAGLSCDDITAGENSEELLLTVTGEADGLAFEGTDILRLVR